MSKLRKLLITSLSAFLIGACVLPVTSAMVKASATENWSDVEIDVEYLVDDTLNIPSRTLTVGGATYEASIKMTYPGGTTKTISAGETVLATPGEYTITYEVRANGKRYSETEEFLVANKLWSVKNPKSSVEYGTVGNTDALLVRLAKNDTLTFNKVVDLANYTTNQELIRAFINPDAVGSYDFEGIIVKVTDAYDPTQVLTVRGYKSSSSVHTVCGSYWTAAGPNQTLCGWDEGAKRYSNRIDIPDGICGAFQLVSFCSQRGWYVNPDFAWEDTTADGESFSVRFDQASKEVYVDAKGSVKKVADLDEPEYYATEPLWKGFTSGKVRISVTADALASETANFAVSKVFGYDDLSVENRFVEEEPPVLTVEVEDKYVEYNENLGGRHSFVPLAVVGGKYPVPTATAFDGYSGELKVETKVYFDYANTKQARTIKNGTFEVHAQGSYAIVYSAKDHMGNAVERIYWVTAVTALDTPLAMTVNKEGVTQNGVCGERITLADYTTTGGSGNEATVTITATCGDTTLDVSGGKLLAEQAGTWTITYQATDYSGITVEDSYEIVIALGDKPVFVDLPVLPRYFISGMEYVVPTVYAYDYTTGNKVEKIAELVLTDANGTKTYKAGETYTPVVDANGNLAMSFVCENATMPIDAKAVAPRSGDTAIYIEKMFITDGVNVTRDKDGLTMTATVDGSSKWMFANALAAEGASLYVEGVKNSSVFSGMKVTFTDYADGNVSVTMYVEHNAAGALKVQFGDTDRELTKGLNLGIDKNGTALNEVSFSHKLGKFYVDGLGVTVTKDDNGNAFNGFPSGRVYMSVEAFGVKAGQKYLVTQIDNHVIGARARDSATPRVAISGQYGGIYDVKSEYVVTSALASDVIDPNVTCTVTVTKPNGEVMTDVNGLELKDVSADREYVIKLNDYGQYKVTYKSTDWAKQNGTSSYAVNVFDQKAPKVSIKGNWASTAKVGESVILPEMEISDDYSSKSALSVYRMVRNPYDVLTVIGYDQENVAYRFTFKFAGEYKFIVVVSDEAGNQSYLEYVVTVS